VVAISVVGGDGGAEVRGAVVAIVTGGAVDGGVVVGDGALEVLAAGAVADDDRAGIDDAVSELSSPHADNNIRPANAIR
jgi:hypothetical protein